MRQFRTSGSVRGVAREGDSYRDKVNVQGLNELSVEPETLDVEQRVPSHRPP